MANTSLRAWVEWKERCALDLCGADTQQCLRDFAGSRFHRLIERYAHATNQIDARRLAARIPAPQAWHLFEVYLRTTKTRTGTRYKDWLFVRAKAAPHAYAYALQLGAFLIMRDVVRRELRRDFPPAHTVSIDSPLADADGLTLADMLPGSADPLNEVVRREWEALADREARQAMDEMSARERIAVLARHLDVALSCPTVCKAAGCAKSVLSTAYRDCIRRIGASINRTYGTEGRESALALTLMTIEALKKLLITWGNSEMTCAPIFLIVEERSGKAPATADRRADSKRT